MSTSGQFVENPLIHQKWLFLAAKIEAEPELLAIALKNLSRWRKSDRLGDFWALDIWERLINGVEESTEGLATLLRLIRADDERARQLKSCSPFPGILTTEELDQFTCASVL